MWQTLLSTDPSSPAKRARRNLLELRLNRGLDLDQVAKRFGPMVMPFLNPIIAELENSELIRQIGNSTSPAVDACFQTKSFKGFYP